MAGNSALLEKMAHFSSVITYGAGRSSQWAKPFVIFSSPGEGKLSAIFIHAQEQCCHGPNFVPKTVFPIKDYIQRCFKRCRRYFHANIQEYSGALIDEKAGK
jgi:hypothetical protein